MGSILSPHPRSIFKSVLETLSYIIEPWCGNKTFDGCNTTKKSKANLATIALIMLFASNSEKAGIGGIEVR